MKIGQLVKTYVRRVFRYCDEVDHEELMRLMDAKYSKQTFGINYPFCLEVESILPQQSMRYWRDIHIVRGKTLRVCSQWVDFPTSKSRELFHQYLLSKKLVDNEELPAIGAHFPGHQPPNRLSGPQEVAIGVMPLAKLKTFLFEIS